MKDDFSSYLNLLEWIKSNDGNFCKMEMKYLNESNRYLVSSTHIDKGQMINFIPQKILITRLIPEVKVYWDTLNKISFFEEYSEQISICAWASQEMNNPNSFWKPYFDFLPKDFSSFPYYFSNEELDYIKGSSFSDEVISKKNQLNTEVEELKILNLPFDPDNYIKARHLLYSRNFYFKIGKNTNANNTFVSSFVPLADVFNYRPEEVNAKWYYDNELDAYTVVAKRNIKQGEEILLDYGYHKNNHFLLYSGFTLKNNTGIEGRLNYSTVEDCPDLGLFGIDLNQALRKYRKNRGNIESYEDEYDAIIILEKKINTIIDLFNTTYDEDVNMLKSIKKNNMINILRVLIEEKKLVNGYFKIIQFFKSVIQNIIHSQKTADHSKNIMKTISSNKTYLAYDTILMNLKIKKVDEMTVLTFNQDEFII